MALCAHGSTSFCIQSNCGASESQWNPCSLFGIMRILIKERSSRMQRVQSRYRMKNSLCGAIWRERVSARRLQMYFCASWNFIWCLNTFMIFNYCGWLCCFRDRQRAHMCKKWESAQNSVSLTVSLERAQNSAIESKDCASEWLWCAEKIVWNCWRQDVKMKLHLLNYFSINKTWCMHF